MKTAIRSLVAGLLVSLVAQFEAMACLNTSYSRVEEKQMTEDLTKILSGQMSEHGEDFYRDQKQKLERKLREDPYDVELHNDLGAAEIKLQNYEAALQRFQLIEELEPGRYKTQANLGVLFKKMGKYERAAEHTRNALTIRPAGHLGLGDYYLRMLNSRAARQAGKASAEKRNFLGTRYSDGPKAAARNPLINREHLITLIKADRHYEDTYIVLGDVLFAEGDLQNAIRAYSKAETMITSDDSQQAEITARIATVLERLEEKNRKAPLYVYDSEITKQLHLERAAAEAWVLKFQKIEAEMIEAGETDVSIGSVKAEMARQAAPEPKYFEVGHFKQRGASLGTQLGFMLFLGGATAAIGIALLVKIVRWANQ